MVTVRFPVAAEQLTVNAAVAVPPEGTETVWELPPLTVQFAATPESVTLWLPAARLVNERLPLIPIAWPGPPSTATVYPSGSRFEPVVLVDTVRLPSAGAVPGFSASTVASQVPGELGEKFQVHRGSTWPAAAGIA